MGRLKMFFHSKQFRCPFIVTHITLRVPQRALKRVHPFLAFPGLACKLWKWAWLCAMQFASVWKCGRWNVTVRERDDATKVRCEIPTNRC